MRQSKHPVVSRRSFLHGVAGTLAIPTFASLSKVSHAANDVADSSNVPASRFVCVSPEYGIYRQSLVPKTAGSLDQLPEPAKALKPFINDISLLSGLDHPGVGGGHACSATLLNGMKESMTDGDRRMMMSFDQFLVQELQPNTRFQSLGAGNGGPISYNSKGVPIPKEGNPQRLFANIFQDSSPKAKESRRRSLQANSSILDAVLEESKSLRNELGNQDKRKFEEYLNAVRETEIKLGRRQSWLDKPRPKAPFDPFAIEGDDGETRHSNEVFYDIVALALQTDATRIMTFQMPGGNGFLPIDGVTMAYHNMTHHGHRPEHIRQLRLVDAWRFQQFAAFLKRLKTIRDENDRPLLDTTIVMFGSGMADASVHSSRNTPIILAGGGFKHGRHHALPAGGKPGEKDTPLCDLFVSISHQMKIESERFSTSQGDLDHLLS